MEQAKISVIIPVYNAEESIRRAAESALQQTWQNLEIILVDDGSTDGSAKICEELSAAHAQVSFTSIPDQGVSVARNTGLDRATGDYVTFLDADDMLAPEMLTELMRIQNETGAEITGCDFRDGDGKAITYNGGHIVTDAILTEHDTRVWGKLYQKSAIGSIRFREGLTIGEDMLFLLEVALNGMGKDGKEDNRRPIRYTLLKKDLYYYTVNPGGAMEKPFVPSYMDQILCWDLAHDLLEQKAPGLLQTQNAAADRLDAVRIVSTVLVGSKIARLSGTNRKQYETEWKSAREVLGSYRRNKGARPYLPKGYRLKAVLMDRIPFLYILLFGRKKNN